MKRFIALIIALILLTPILWLGAYLAHPKAKIGIIMVDQCEEHLGEIAVEAFDHYGDYFEAEILPERFDASEVRIKDSAYLNSDFFKLGETSRLKKQYDVDMILFVTDHLIKNWDGNGAGIWGQANLQTGSALMTMAPWRNTLPNSSIIIKHVALHEIFHLLGYTHNRWNRNGIMQYAMNAHTLDLCPYYEIQLPVRIITYKLGIGLNFKIGSLLVGLTWALVLMPAFTAAELVIYKIYKKLEGKRTSSKVLIPLSCLQAFILSTTTVGAYYTLLFPLVFFLFFHHLYYAYYLFKDNRKDFPI
jgi:hypothetical protein